ncbi:MAG: flagellar protein FlgN [Hydrogenovibrio sp.]|nr:flagellar protein FlgN [Hydrogenovibrio sp.]
MFKTVDLDLLSLQLSQLLDTLNDFEKILDEEAQVLKSTDISPLTDIVQRKQIASESVSQKFETLSTSLTDNALSLNEYMMIDGFDQLPTSIQTLFKQNSEKAQVCNDKNTANGMSVQALSNLNQTLLQLFKGQDPQNKTYDASGGESNAASRSKPLGKA